jgi:hypothetical protein
VKNTKKKGKTDKIISILELDENKSFLLCELDNDIEKQKKILEMKVSHFSFRLV